VRWMARHLGIPHLRALRSAGDVQELLSRNFGPDVFFHEPVTLAAHALSCGLLMPVASASYFARRTLVDAAATSVLGAYSRLLHGLADAPAPAAVPMAGRNAHQAAPPAPAGAPAALSAVCVAGHAAAADAHGGHFQLQLPAPAAPHAAPELGQGAGHTVPPADPRALKRARDKRHCDSKRQKLQQLPQAQQDALREAGAAKRREQRAVAKLRQNGQGRLEVCLCAWPCTCGDH
jgi:hypothetical protein